MKPGTSSCGGSLHGSTHLHARKHALAAPPHLTPAPCTNHRPWPGPGSLPRTPTGTGAGLLTSVASVVAGQQESPWEQLGPEHFLLQLPLSRPRSGTVPGSDPPPRDY